MTAKKPTKTHRLMLEKWKKDPAFKAAYSVSAAYRLGGLTGTFLTSQLFIVEFVIGAELIPICTRKSRS